MGSRDAPGLTAKSKISAIHRDWAEQALKEECLRRDTHSSESVAVGSQAFVEGVQAQLGT